MPTSLLLTSWDLLTMSTLERGATSMTDQARCGSATSPPLVPREPTTARSGGDEGPHGRAPREDLHLR